MGSRSGPIERGRSRGQTLRRGIGQELRDARIQHDLSLATVGRPAGLSASTVSRIERGLVRSLDLEGLAIVCAAVGLDLAVRAFPAGEPLRDAAHVALLGRLRARLHPGVSWRSEVPLPIPGDLRAWDAMLMIERRQVGVEAETRPHDLQALQRRLALKMRDGGIDTVILLLADTRYNRRFVRERADDLAAHFPVPGRRALELIGAGAHPGAGAVILL